MKTIIRIYNQSNAKGKQDKIVASPVSAALPTMAEEAASERWVLCCCYCSSKYTYTYMYVCVCVRARARVYLKNDIGKK